MIITKAIAEEISIKAAILIRDTPEIVIYANSNTHQYQWKDERYKETSNPWDNPMYDTRGEMRTFLKQYLKL